MNMAISSFSMVPEPSLSNSLKQASKSASDDEQGSTLGIFQSAGSLARVIAPLIAGFLCDVRANLPLLCGAALIGVGAFSWLFYVKKRSVRML
jgi:MFS family permease